MHTENRYRHTGAIFFFTVGIVISGCAHEAKTPQPITVSLQGGPPPTCADPLVRGFYEISVKEFANGAANVDLVSYEQKTFAQIRAIATPKGVNADAIIDHIKDIPRQMIQIVKEDPKVLESCRNFNLAVSGPP